MIAWRILLVDDHPMVCRGLREIFDREPDFTVVGEAPGAERALAIIAEGQTDLALIDVRLRGTDGLALMRQLRESAPKVRVLAMSAFFPQGTLQAVKAAGAHGFLTKESSPEQVLAAARSVLTGDGGFAGLAPHHCASSLSSREWDVLTHLSLGETNGEIAEKLNISQATVRTHIKNILDKMGVSTRGKAVARAFMHF